MRSLGRLRIPLVVLAVVLSLSVVTSAGSLSFTADRQTGLNVSADQNGVVGLDRPAEIQKGGQDTLLVAVTNPTTSTFHLVVRISGDDWSFNSSLGQDVTNAGDDEILRTEIGTESTDEIRVNVENNAEMGERPYDITVESPDFDFRKTASVDIVAGKGKGSGNGSESGSNQGCESSGGEPKKCN